MSIPSHQVIAQGRPSILLGARSGASILVRSFNPQNSQIVQAGYEEGQMLYWSEAEQRWKPIQTADLRWDNQNKELILGNGTKLKVNTIVHNSAGSWQYWGNPDFDDTWRFGRLDGIESAMVLQQRVSGEWVTKHTFDD